MPAGDSSKIKEKVRHLPNGPGVYLMKDRLGRIIYVGKAKSLKKRVSTYFQASRRYTLQPKIRALVDVIADFDILEVKNETEALLLEGKLIKEWKPRYNTDFTDDKRFLLLRVDMDGEMPRFRLTRMRKEDGSRYFGPFAHAGPLRRTLSELRRKFGVLLSDGLPQKLPDGTYRLYNDVRAELYGHANIVSKETYRERVEKACQFLEGKTREWIAELRKEMSDSAAAREFEKAAQCRDLLFSLEQTLIKSRKFTRDPLVNGERFDGLRQLQDALALPALPKKIECFDISHISGTYVVASMVHFSEGRPDKNNYRRFKIRSFIGNDDFRAMEEVVGRRYRRLAEENRTLPDLIVIDGGKGQVSAALKAFLILDLPHPPLIGLAKKEETIIFADGREPINLPDRDPGLRLLQRVRDEAHRFANTFNADLRSKLIRESVLDDFPGLGKVRRAALMEHFKSIDRLKQATADEIAEVRGIGPGMAKDLRDFLRQRV